MSRYIRISGWGLFIVLIIIQITPPRLPETSPATENDLFNHASVPDDIGNIIKNSCYDCHSNETHYPWYSYVAPVKWLISGDINGGRHELNFSNWNEMRLRDQVKILEDISEEVDEGEMPLKIYTIMHRNARLSKAERQKIVDWTEDMTNQIFAGTSDLQ